MRNTNDLPLDVELVYELDIQYTRFLAQTAQVMIPEKSRKNPPALSQIKSVVRISMKLHLLNKFMNSIELKIPKALNYKFPEVFDSLKVNGNDQQVFVAEK